MNRKQNLVAKDVVQQIIVFTTFIIVKIQKTEFAISEYFYHQFNEKHLQIEVAKCEVFCAHCHRIVQDRTLAPLYIQESNCLKNSLFKYCLCPSLSRGAENRTPATRSQTEYTTIMLHPDPNRDKI